MLGAQKFYGQLDLDNATYSFDCLRADAKVAHLRKGVNGAKRVRHGGGGDALVVHPVKEEDEITANDDNGGGGGIGDDGTIPETAALIQRRRRRRKRQKSDDNRGEGAAGFTLQIGACDCAEILFLH